MSKANVEKIIRLIEQRPERVPTDAPAFVSHMDGVIDAAYNVEAISKEEYEELFDDYVNLFIICHSPKDIERMSIKEQISSVKKFIESKQQVRKMSDEEIDAFLKGELV